MALDISKECPLVAKYKIYVLTASIGVIIFAGLAGCICYKKMVLSLNYSSKKDNVIFKYKFKLMNFRKMMNLKTTLTIIKVTE